jgi:hypothetical protein
MPSDPFIREKFTRESSTARRAVREYFKRYPKEQFQTDVKTSMTSVTAEWKIAEVFGIGTVDPGRACRRMVKCELAHNRFALFRCRIVKSRRVQAMIQQPAKGMPQWLTIDALIILVGLAIIGIEIWIAP